MNKELTCLQVSALLTFYIKDRLNPRLKDYVDRHLKKCPQCQKKVNELRNILKKYSNTNSENNEKTTATHKYQQLLSAYVDNELDTNESIKVKKMSITNNEVRKELETMYKYKTALNNAYQKTKNDLKTDYSKSVLKTLQENDEYSTTYFYKIATIFVVLITTIIGCFIYLYL